MAKGGNGKGGEGGKGSPSPSSGAAVAVSQAQKGAENAGLTSPSKGTPTDAAGIAVSQAQKGAENAGLTNPNNPSNKGEDSKGQTTLGHNDYNPGATYNAQGQQTSGWSSGPGMSSGKPHTITPNEVFNMAKQKQMEQIQEKGLLKSFLEGNSTIGLDNPTPLTSAANVAGTIAGLFSSFGKAKGEEGETTPTYNPSLAAENNTPASMKEGAKESKAAPTTESTTTADAISVLGHNDYTPGTPAETSANNNVNQQAQSSSGYINRGSTISTTGTGGSISSGLSVPERDSGSIGLGVFDPDKANYDQDNWNRGMEVQSSSVVSDEQCKQFAMRAFHEDSPAFKVVKETIIKKLD